MYKNARSRWEKRFSSLFFKKIFYKHGCYVSWLYDVYFRDTKSMAFSVLKELLLVMERTSPRTVTRSLSTMLVLSKTVISLILLVIVNLLSNVPLVLVKSLRVGMKVREKGCLCDLMKGKKISTLFFCGY